MPQLNADILNQVLDDPMLRMQLDAEREMGLIPEEFFFDETALRPPGFVNPVTPTATSGPQVPDWLAASMNEADPAELGLADRLMREVVNRNKINPLTEEEQAELGRLQDRNQRLQPISYASPYSLGTPMDPSNPYSLDTRGVATSVRNAITGVINGVRNKRRGGFDDRLNTLQGQVDQNARNQATQDAFFARYYPGLLETEYKEKAQAARDENRFNNSLIMNGLEFHQDLTLQDIKDQAALNRIRKTAEIRRLGANGNPEVSASILREYAESITWAIGPLEMKIKRINDELASPINSANPTKIAELELELSETESLLEELYNERADVLRDSGLAGDQEDTTTNSLPTIDLTEDLE